MNELMSSGIELMLIGMGIVYVFLAMLVFAINVMTALVSRYFPSPPPELTAPIAESTDSSHIAAITAAVHQYRNKHQ